MQRLTSPGRYSDGNGLYLQVSKTGTKSWLYRYMLNGKPREMGLGAVAFKTLAEARVLAMECKKLTLHGLDPIDDRIRKKRQCELDAANNITFDQCATEYIEAHKPSWKNQKHCKQWQNTLATYVSPTIGKMSIQSIETDHVLRVLKPIWTVKTETASRIRNRIELILSYAIATGYRVKGNPAIWRGHLDKLLPSRASIKPVKHFTALALDRVGLFVKELQDLDGIAPRALEFLILTGTRTGEVIGAKWSEINLHDKLWSIPASRMKTGREHRVPLSKRAFEIISELSQAKLSEHIFVSRNKNKPLSNMALLAVIKRMNYNITTHGFRSSFRDWISEYTQYPNEVAELALAHSISNKVEAAYRRGDLLIKRQLMMQEWAQFCSIPLEHNVLKLNLDKKVI